MPAEIRHSKKWPKRYIHFPYIFSKMWTQAVIYFSRKHSKYFICDFTYGHCAMNEFVTVWRFWRFLTHKTNHISIPWKNASFWYLLSPKVRFSSRSESLKIHKKSIFKDVKNNIQEDDWSNQTKICSRHRYVSIFWVKCMPSFVNFFKI